MTHTSSVVASNTMRVLATGQELTGDGLVARIHELKRKLRSAKLRGTRQRIALGRLLFGSGSRHVTAEGLHKQAMSLKLRVSLATVYNTLHEFTKAGLLNEIPVGGPRIFFDTNTVPHHHFLVDETNELIDIPANSVSVGCLRESPAGTEVARVDLIVHLRKLKTPSLARRFSMKPRDLA
jgi:Fur family transcriptional regulator, iron response regulator